MQIRIRLAVVPLLASLFAITSLSIAPEFVVAQQVAPAIPSASKPVIEEWVYRTKYGFKDEWWTIFKKYQIPILERQKQLGYVKDFTIYAPSAHASEDSRWDYRVIIIRASGDAPSGQSEGEIAKQLFPDQTTFKTR